MGIVANSFALPVSTQTSYAKPRASFFSRCVKALQASREMQARREIARHQHLIDQVTSLRTPDVTSRNDLPF